MHVVLRPKIYQYLLLMCLLTFAKPLCAQNLEILAVEYPPFTSASTDNESICTTLLREFFKGTNIQPTLRILPLARIHNLVNRGEWVASLVPVTATDSEAYWEVLYSQKEISYSIIAKQVNSTQSLEGSRIAILNTLKTNYYYEVFTKMGLNVVTVNEYSQLINMMNSGRVDFITGIVSDGIILTPKADDSEEYVEVKEVSKIPFLLYLNKNNPLASKIYNTIHTE